MTDKTPEELATEHAIDNASEAYEALRKAYLAGYEAGRPKWVKTSEHLPEVNKEVLAISDTGFMMVTCMVPDETWTDPEENTYERKRYLNLFTHWQPLPTPPIKEP